MAPHQNRTSIFDASYFAQGHPNQSVVGRADVRIDYAQAKFPEWGEVHLRQHLVEGGAVGGVHGGPFIPGPLQLAASFIVKLVVSK